MFINISEIDESNWVKEKHSIGILSLRNVICSFNKYVWHKVECYGEQNRYSPHPSEALGMEDLYSTHNNEWVLCIKMGELGT